MDNPMLLHIYAQSQWHATASFHGTRDAIIALRDCLDQALRTGAEAHSQTFFVNDGEGYHVRITVESEEAMEHMPTPYTDSITRGEA